MDLIKQLEQEQMAKLTAGKTLPTSSRATPSLSTTRWWKASAAVFRPMRACASGARAAGLNENFTVRKISYGEGVERVFPLYSPMIDSIKLVRRGKVRRAKLYYLARSARQARAQSSEKQERQSSDSTEAAAIGSKTPNGPATGRLMAKPRTLYDKIWTTIWLMRRLTAPA